PTRSVPPTSTPPSGTGQKAAAETAEVTALRPAFALLLHADHDYRGHRVKAMHAIAAACRLMGTDILPPGLGQKPPTASAGQKPQTAGAGGKSPTAGTGANQAKGEPEAQNVSDNQRQQAQT